MVSGIVILNKEDGITSQGAVNRVFSVVYPNCFNRVYGDGSGLSVHGYSIPSQVAKLLSPNLQSGVHGWGLHAFTKHCADGGHNLFLGWDLVALRQNLSRNVLRVGGDA